MRACILLLSLAQAGSLTAQTVLPEAVQKVEPEDDPNLAHPLTDPTRVEVTVDALGNPVFLRSTVELPDNVVHALAQLRFRPGTVDGNKAGFAMFVDARVKRSSDRYLATAFRQSDKPWVRPIYGKAKLKPDTAAESERGLTNDEASVDARAQLLRYAVSSSAQGPQGDRAAIELRARQITWLVNNQRGAGILGTPAALIFPSAGALQDPAGFEVVKSLWLEQVSKYPKDAVVLGHAAWFLELSDPASAEQILTPRTLSVGGAAACLGKLYGDAALGITRVGLENGAPVAGERMPETDYSKHARSTLAETVDERVLLSALSTVTSLVRSLGAAGRLPIGYQDFCDHLLARAKAFYPGASQSCAAPDGAHQGPQKVTAARLVRQDKPVYPAEARRSGVRGTVTFSALIGKDGKLRDVELLSGPLALYAASRAAVMKWEYEPTRVDGASVEVSTTLDVNLNLSH